MIAEKIDAGSTARPRRVSEVIGAVPRSHNGFAPADRHAAL
ncbi:hypothetical protein [Streptomyces sp. NPDC001205]